ncbi:hypothetical protein E2562_014134 [Oryza meyeriana var. granulata]|uniref:Uncharacterized protein n=1 Tax=Oryza meyeriana var. granulata TaxID=110450 RepID=A0A6G1F8F9_9ORYZ|nr:hypothetical protein E2562_014134 [Oryza meyeriana var. granulata]
MGGSRNGLDRFFGEAVELWWWSSGMLLRGQRMAVTRVVERRCEVETGVRLNWSSSIARTPGRQVPPPPIVVGAMAIIYLE